MCYFLYITIYNTLDNIKPFGYCIHHGPLPVCKTYNKTESTYNDVSDKNMFLGMHKHTWGLVISV